MDRRDFVRGSLLFLGSSVLPRPEACEPFEAASPGSDAKLTIEYPRKEIRAIEVPPYRGQSYEDKVPDTLDIAHRAELGVHVLTSIADPKADYEVYWLAQWDRNPPIMLHDFNDWVQSVEGLMEALPLLRVVTGSDLNQRVDPAWMQVNLKSIGPDGLVYLPLKGIAWSRLHAVFIEPVWRADGSTTKFSDESVALVTGVQKCGRTISAMTVYYLRDKDPIWKNSVERMIQRLADLTVDRGHYGYIPEGGFEPNAKVGPEARMPTGILAIEGGNIRLIQGLAQYYKATGYEPARKLAAKLVPYAMGPAQTFDSQGRFLFSPVEKGFVKTLYPMPYLEPLKYGGHFHAHTIALLSILEYARVVGDREALEFVKSGYEWAKTQGSSLVGFFPEMIVEDRYTGCESCEIGDMISIAVKLTEAGAGDYWDDVDRWVRNQFAEQQVTQGNWIYRVGATMEKKPVAYNETDERVAESVIGGFLGRATANESGVVMPHCCTGNCVRALYYVWEHMLEHQGQQLRVNLLLNRASPWADVYSRIPYEGRVDLKIKKPLPKVLVRAPQWIKSGNPDVSCKVNVEPRTVHWEGRFMNLGNGLPGDQVTVTFPIEERAVRETIGAVPYTLVLKGSTVVSIDPPGKNGPLYQRAHYRSNQVRWRNARRFVPEETIVW